MEDHTMKKLLLLYRGFYTIREVRENNTIVVEEKDGTSTTHHIKNIKIYLPPDPGRAVEKMSC